MADSHPIALRPGGSPSPNPEQQSHQQPLDQEPHTMDNHQQVPNPYPSRFASANYQHPNPVVEAGSGQSPTSTGLNPFADHGARSRSSTTNQSYTHEHHPNMPPTQQPYTSRPASRSTTTSPSYSRPQTSSTTKSPFSTPITAPTNHRTVSLLLINPNSTPSMTTACLTTLRPTLPPSLSLTGYTAPYPAPTAIESHTDAIMSTEACLRDLAKHAAANGETVQNFDGMIVACYSAHPLIDALRESYDVPVIGIMEASLYAARMLGGRFGIIATGKRSVVKQADAVAAYGLAHFYVGSEATELGVLELESKDRQEVARRVGNAARSLVAKGADTVLLGCAGMTGELVRAAKDGVREEDGTRKVNVVDGVEAAVHLMSALVGLGVPTSKKWLYKGEREGRRARGQNWL